MSNVEIIAGTKGIGDGSGEGELVGVAEEEEPGQKVQELARPLIVFQ